MARPYRFNQPSPKTTRLGVETLEDRRLLSLGGGLLAPVSALLQPVLQAPSALTQVLPAVQVSVGQTSAPSGTLALSVTANGNTLSANQGTSPVAPSLTAPSPTSTGSGSTPGQVPSGGILQGNGGGALPSAPTVPVSTNSSGGSAAVVPTTTSTNSGSPAAALTASGSQSGSAVSENTPASSPVAQPTAAQPASPAATAVVDSAAATQPTPASGSRDALQGASRAVQSLANQAGSPSAVVLLVNESPTQQAAEAIRMEATDAAPVFLPAVPEPAAFAGQDQGTVVLDGNSAPAVRSGIAPTSLRAASYSVDALYEDQNETAPVLPDSAEDMEGSGLLSNFVPADTATLDLAFQQLQDQLGDLGRGLNQLLPGGVAFWLLAGALGATASMTLCRSQSSRRGLLWAGSPGAFPEFTGFLPE